MNKAVIFVDVQNDFVKGGKLAFGYPAEDNLQKIVEFAKECVDTYRKDATSYIKIYATRDTHEATKWVEKNCAQVVVGYLSTLEGQKLPVEHCVEGTEGWQIVDKLTEVLLGNATFVNKSTFGGYDLVDIIAEDFENNALDEIIIAGYCTSICVLANAVLLRAKFPNTKITVRADLCGDVNEEAHRAALKIFEMQQIDVVNG